MPRRIRSRLSIRARCLQTLRLQLKREPTDIELSRAMQISVDDLRKLSADLEPKSPLPLSTVLGKDRRMDTMREAMDPQPRIEPGEEILEIATRDLRPKERAVLIGYYFHDKAMHVIANELGCSESLVCQIHASLLPMLRRRLKDYRSD